MKLTSRILKEIDDFKEYARIYENMSGNKTSVEHFMRISTVRAFYNEKKEIVGGYSLNSNLPIRYYADIPAGALTDEHPLESEVVEGGGLWMDDNLHPIHRCRIFLTSFIEIYKLKKPYIIGGARHPKVAKVQLSSLPNIIYEGPIGEYKYVCIMYGSIKSLPKMALYIILKYGVMGTIKDFMSRLKRFIYSPLKS
ncbi:hypothetical protein ACU6U9_14900 [Pseudomonas sp. HK3]|jgi:hypothetical protein